MEIFTAFGLSTGSGLAALKLLTFTPYPLVARSAGLIVAERFRKCKPPRKAVVIAAI